MLKVGDHIEMSHHKKTGLGTIKIGPYPLEFQAKYPDGHDTTFVDDAYDVILEGSTDIITGVRRRYLKKVKV